MSAVADLEAGLGAMLHLKPPGVSTSRIKSLTELCQNNIKVWISALAAATYRAPSTQRLIRAPGRISPCTEILHSVEEGAWNS